ncbi:MAG: hypothetical protein FWD47_14805 [Treponema sp.]|nr:hypothetical protein [Treponema sp.]
MGYTGNGVPLFSGSGSAYGAFGTTYIACSNCQIRGDNSCWVCSGTGKVPDW